MPVRLPYQSSVWESSIGRALPILSAGLAFGLALTGCSQIPQASANIAFMGDSITAFWWLPKSNLGVYGNTTAQMLARYPREVSGHGYKAIVILGGTNNVRVVKTPIEQEVISAMSGLEQMATLAEKENLEVVLCTIPPIEGLDSRVEALDTQIVSYSKQHNYKLVDYYTPMFGHPEYFRDGEHPNDQGYFVMQRSLTPVIPLDY
jgi:acyl-CoA thioesterase-1